jgi:hypothetical protein
VAHSYRCDSGCNIGESGGVFEWATQMGAILGVILVNCGVFKWPTTMGEILVAIWVNWVGCLSGPLNG